MSAQPASLSLIVRVHVRFAGALLVAASILVAGLATAKCALISTREHFLRAKTVVLVSIVEAHDGPVPWPFGIQEKGTLPGRLLKLRVVRSWKGALRSDEVVDGWTLSSRGEDAYPHTDVGTQLIVFYRKGSPHEIMSCNAADPDRLDDVSKELDAIIREAAVQVYVSAETCLIGNHDVPCSDVGTKLRELGTPLDAQIHVIGVAHASYKATSAALESLRSAGFQLKVGHINLKAD